MKLKTIKNKFIEGKLKKEIGWCVIMGAIFYLVSGIFWMAAAFLGVWLIIILIILLSAKGKIVW